MKPFTQLAALGILAGCSLTALAQNALEPIPIPFKPDPPLMIDGDLSDWSDVPGKKELKSKDHATYGGAAWKGNDDLSATVQLSWRQEALFVAAEVTDDVLRQTERGANLWKGDHIELYIDTAPQNEPDKSTFGTRQFQVGMSPGNFQNTGDSLTDISPEAYVFLPAGIAADGIDVAAQRTANGYTIEASIPWEIFNYKPQTGLPLNVEVAISDTDGTEASQGKMLTLGTAVWRRNRSRLLPAVLANADGSAPALATKTSIAESAEMAPGKTQDFTFDAPKIPEGYEAYLSLNARLDSPKAAGYTRALEATLNGKTIDSKRLSNKETNEERVNGAMMAMYSGNNFTVPYAPDFEATDKHNSYALKNAKAALIELRVTDLLQEKDNKLVIKNAVKAGIDKDLTIGDVQLIYRIPEVPKVLLPPPSGDLPMIAPQPLQPVKYSITQNADGSFQLQHGKSTFTVSSQYSTPAGKWETASNKYFSVDRQIEQKDNWIIVKDTFTNLTDENLPLMHRNQVAVKPDKVWLAGLSPNGLIGTAKQPHNPTVFATQGESGIGLLPLDDVFQVHINNFSTPDAIGLEDNSLVLKPKTTYTAEWAIIPTANADNYDFINTTRNLLNTNFQFDGSFAFLRVNPTLTGTWSDQEIADFLKYKDAKYTSISIGYPKYKGQPSHGTAFQQVDHSEWKKEIARRRKIAPDVKQLSYFHNYIDVTDEAPEKFKDSRLIMPDGSQGDYGKEALRLFVPTLTNSYGKAVDKNIDKIYDELKLDGVYWDEPAKSRYSYDYNPDVWDGFSADIDSKTMKIKRLKSSVTLLSLPWRMELTKNILKRGVLVENAGNPETRTMRNLMIEHRIPAFVETGSITNSTRNQLYTPIALGDHLTERSEEDAYHVMLGALDYGLVYYWYFDMTVRPTHHTLTQYMFPITPVELHEGYIIGRERIITNRSGVFGWNDSSEHEIHVYDNKGREVDLKDIKSPTVIKTYKKDGNTWSEIRIGELWSAVIVKK